MACSLLGIKQTEELNLTIFKGHLFEGLIISDFYKQFYNMGQQPPLYFWRDRNGLVEIDCIFEKAGKLTPIEIKSGKTFDSSFFDGLKKWNVIAETEAANNYLVYGGELTQLRQNGNLVGWQQSATLMNKLS